MRCGGQSRRSNPSTCYAIRIPHTVRRELPLAPESRVLYCVACIEHDDTQRIISLRHANRRDVTHYVENT